MSRFTIILMLGGSAVIAIGGYLAVRRRHVSKTDALAADAFKDAIIADQSAVVLDVRTPGEFRGGCIAGAKNIDFYDPGFRDAAARLDPTKTYYVYCRSGHRSRQAAASMRAVGIPNVIELAGGIGSAPELAADQ